MPYFIRTLYNKGEPIQRSETLVEMTQRQTEQADISKVGYDRVSGTFAHQWVRDGGHHMTPLYVDYDGRIRYARDFK